MLTHFSFHDCINPNFNTYCLPRVCFGRSLKSPLRSFTTQDQIVKNCNCRSYETRLKQYNRALKRPPNNPPPKWFSKDCPVNGSCQSESILSHLKYIKNGIHWPHQ